MPIFEYRCAGCAHRFDVLAPRADDAAPPCPRCGSAGAERQRSAFAVLRASAGPVPGPCGSQDCACRRAS